mgnify:CR=1 FL=1
MAAAVLGCVTFDPDTKIKGVILNRVAGTRHEKVLRKNIEHYCDIPVLGAVPKLDWQSFPERHMGLLPTPEHGWAKDSIQAASQLADRYLDLEALAAVAGDAGTGEPDAHEGREYERVPACRCPVGHEREENDKTNCEMCFLYWGHKRRVLV